MYLLEKITIQNFRGFRDKVNINLESSSYFVGMNNAGKTTILNAIRFFFDKDFLIDEDFINKTSFLSKKRLSNQAEVTVHFKLDNLIVKSSRINLIKKYGHSLSVSKIIVISTETKAISRKFKINNKAYEKLPEEIVKLIDSVKVTYLHPQEGKDLLSNAQEKLKQRLLANWGRNSNITTSIKEVQLAWEDLREKTNKYLSGALTENLQRMWPESSVAINLPKSIKDVMEISDIHFLGYDGAPEIKLNLQGTGAQSTVLYLTHFLLDSDRSLHRGEYHPLWLIEEPESFLHADLLINLAKQLNSDRWLNNIQMAVSTHSPLLLAGTRLAGDKINWTILEKYKVKRSKLSIEYDTDEIKAIGQMMGDPNFYEYFTIFQDKKLIFLEDESDIIKERFIYSGIPVSDGLKGITWVNKYIDILRATPEILQSEAYFIVDSDIGLKQIKKHIDSMVKISEDNGFKKYKYDTSNIYVITLPEGRAVEFLFDEYEEHLDDCMNDIWERNFSIKGIIPTNLSRVMSKVRKSKPVENMKEALELIQNEQDIKDLFWNNVKSKQFKINTKNLTIIKSMLSL